MGKEKRRRGHFAASSALISERKKGEKKRSSIFFCRGRAKPSGKKKSRVLELDDAPHEWPEKKKKKGKVPLLPLLA